MSQYTSKQSALGYQASQVLDIASSIDLEPLFELQELTILYRGAANGLISDYGFSSEDRILAKRIGIFSNLADGLILTDDIYISFISTNSGGAGTNPRECRINALNTWFDLDFFINPQGPSGAVQVIKTLGCAGSLNPSLIDASLDGSNVFFDLVIETEHTFDLVSA